MAPESSGKLWRAPQSSESLRNASREESLPTEPPHRASPQSVPARNLAAQPSQELQARPEPSVQLVSAPL
eukprot:8383331-Alexandrium_andersonii.AAC.1